MAHKQNDVVQVINDTVANYRLIADFGLRPNCVDKYEKTIIMFNDYEKILKEVVTNNMYMAPWITTFLIGFWFMYGAWAVVPGGSMSLGAFLATINVFKEVGAEFTEIYAECMEIQQSFGPLEKICQYMNIETDLGERMESMSRREEEGTQKRAQVIAAMRGDDQAQKRLSRQSFNITEGALPIDTINLEIQDLSFSYSEDAQVLDSVTVSFPQGLLYAFVGPAHEGKSTLLKLIGQVLIPSPECGWIFIPSHLRVLHISQSECLVDDTFEENLRLYAKIHADKPLTNEEELQGKSQARVRIEKICRMVGMEDNLLQLLWNPEVEQASDDHGGHGSGKSLWSGMLSHTDFARLNLARALVKNPECLVMHKPDMVFDPQEVDKIMELLTQHVKERGLELRAENRNRRRPRTVFFTTTTMTGVGAADRVFEVKKQRDRANMPTLKLPRKGFKVHIISASGLANADPLVLGKSDPYCAMKVSRRGMGSHGKQHLTDTVIDDLNPKWNASVDVTKLFVGDELRFEVRDSDFSKIDDFLGHCTLQITRQIFDDGWHGELKLESKTEDPTEQARMQAHDSRLNIKVEPFGPVTFSYPSIVQEVNKSDVLATELF